MQSKREDRARVRIIFIGVILGIFGGVAPIALTAWLSWNTALNGEQDRLHAMSARVIARAELSLGQAQYVLTKMNQETVEACSSAHIATMRKLAMNIRLVEEIGYVENHFLKCTSWGMLEKKIAQDAGNFISPEGLSVTLGMLPELTGSRRMLIVQLGNYNVLINPERFLDVIVDKGINLALARENGRVIISEAGVTEPDFMSQILDGKISSADKTHLFVTDHKNGWIAIAAVHREDMSINLHTEQTWMLPLGAFISLFIVLVVVKSSRKRLSPESELRLAVKNREFIVHYQPILDLRTGRCVGAEALVRWRRPDGAMVRPDLFIPLAEDTGLVMMITDQVVEAVVRDLRETLVSDRSLHIAINLCADDIRTGRILSVLTDALRSTGIHTKQIWLEATERGLMDINSARLTLAKARELGHSTAIDDFGTGYSSLQYLQGLPMDALKIDKAFVSTIGTDSVSGTVIGHIIDMAKSLNLFIVAEGVERQEQVDYLVSRGVDFAQGWLYSKALSINEFLAFYHKTSGMQGSGPLAIQSG